MKTMAILGFVILRARGYVDVIFRFKQTRIIHMNYPCLFKSKNHVFNPNGSKYFKTQKSFQTGTRHSAQESTKRKKRVQVL
jgi:hypothetical protein